MNTLKKICVGLVICLSFGACQKVSVSIDAEQILFNAFDMTFEVGVDTKATVVTESTLNTSGFKVSCTTGLAGSESSAWNSVSFSKSGGVFKGSRYWPASDPSYHFYASNATITANSGGCTVAATNSTDVVCAYLPSPYYKDVNTLEFKHIFARIGNVTFTNTGGYTITGISVNIAPRTGGTYNLRTGNGETDGTGWSSLTTGSVTNIANSTPGVKANDLYLVPGRYTVTASWTASKNGYTYSFENKTCEIDIVGGSINAITASLTGNATEISFTVSVLPWNNNTIALGSFPLHGDVDLGLRDGAGNRILWATTNIGADSEWEIGDYFYWGETSKGYTSISGSTIIGSSSSPAYYVSSKWSKYTASVNDAAYGGTADGRTQLELSDDVARQMWGGDWRMPTLSEWTWLQNNCSSTYYSDYNSTGVPGWKFTNAGNSIFIPMTGYGGASTISEYPARGLVWGSDVNTSNPNNASLFSLTSGYAGVSTGWSRTIRIPVRPVRVSPPTGNWTFAGLQIAPAPLFYNGTTFTIKDLDWNHSSYNSVYGKSNGSYYFNYVELGTYFDSRGNSFASTDNIDGAGLKINFNGHGDWRIPSNTEWAAIITTDSAVRPGSNVNGNVNKHYAFVRLTGVTFAGNSTPLGLLLFPDGNTIAGKALSGMDNSTPTNGMTNEELNTYLAQGCCFIPCSGRYTSSTWSLGGTYGYNWAMNQSNSSTGYILQANTDSGATISGAGKGTFWTQVYLVRSVN